MIERKTKLDNSVRYNSESENIFKNVSISGRLLSVHNGKFIGKVSAKRIKVIK